MTSTNRDDHPHTIIGNELRWNNGTLQYKLYYTSTDKAKWAWFDVGYEARDWDSNNGNPSNPGRVTDNDSNPLDYYLVYSPDPSSSSGGGQGGSSGGNLEEVGKSKTLTPNNDGTYTLSLSVKGHSSLSSVTTAKKANVLFVMDRSSSMITKTVSDDEVFWYYGTWNTNETTFRGDISPSNGYQFYGVIDDEYVPLNASPWNWGNYNFFYQSGTNMYTPYPENSPLYVKSKKTRMVAEQEALSTLFSQLMEKNDASGVNKDVIEISVISFGDERFDDKSWRSETEVGWTSGRNTAPLMNGVLSNRFTSGTNWEEALEYAHDVISAKKEADGENEDYYVIFLTDGEPTAVHGNLPGQVPYQNNNIGAYNAAKDDAQKLVNDDKVEFYNIFTYRKGEDQTYSIYLTNYAYSNGESDYNQSDTEAINTYFSDAQTIDALNDTF